MIPPHFYNAVTGIRSTSNARQGKSWCSGSTHTTVPSGPGSIWAICEAADWNQTNPTAITPGEPHWLPKQCGFEVAPGRASCTFNSHLVSGLEGDGIHKLSDNLLPGEFSFAHISRGCLMSPTRQSSGQAAVPCLLCSLFLGPCCCPQPSQAQISWGAESSCANYGWWNGASRPDPSCD